MNTEIGLWKHKITGETYEISRISLKTKDLQMRFKSGFIEKSKEPFLLNNDWNKFDSFERIE